MLRPLPPQAISDHLRLGGPTDHHAGRSLVLSLDVRHECRPPDQPAGSIGVEQFSVVGPRPGEELRSRSRVEFAVPRLGVEAESGPWIDAHPPSSWLLERILTSSGFSQLAFKGPRA